MEQIQIGDSNPGAGSIRFDTLPEDCISMVISHTSPRDACVVASVSKTVKSAAESDLVWEKFLPPEYSCLIPVNHHHASKKEVYMSLADGSVLIDGGKKSFWLEKCSGKKCYMLSALDLTIVWGDSPAYWDWISLPESKFEKVAELRKVCWLEIRGKISCRMLSKGTYYSVYVVFKRASFGSRGFIRKPIEAVVGFAGKEGTEKLVFFEPGDMDSRSNVYSSDSRVSDGVLIITARIRGLPFPIEEVEEEREIGGGRDVEEPKERGDGWSEVELGKFYINNNGEEDCDEIEISIMETQNTNWKSGLIFQGIEIRPERR